VPNSIIAKPCILLLTTLKDRENEGALEKLYPAQMDILEEERQKYVQVRDAGIAARKNIAIEGWANINQKWLSDGNRLDIENVFFQLYEESVGRDDFGRVFVNPKVNIESDQWGLGKNNFMTKDATTGDWTFHLARGESRILKKTINPNLKKIARYYFFNLVLNSSNAFSQNFVLLC